MQPIQYTNNQQLPINNNIGNHANAVIIHGLERLELDARTTGSKHLRTTYMKVCGVVVVYWLLELVRFWSIEDSGVRLNSD